MAVNKKSTAGEKKPANKEKSVNKVRGLGKGLEGMGLDVLIPNDSSNEMTADNVSRETLLNINLIEPNPLQPRRNFGDDALQELADSIKLHGVIQPLVVQKKNEMYEIIAGERRWRASRLAGLKEVPVIIKDYSEDEIFEIALIENIQREDLNPVEEAMAYQKLIQEHNLKQDEVAERVSKSRVAVTNSLRLLKLDPRVQQMVIDELLTGGHARALISITEPDKQYEIANKVFDEKLSVRETEKLVKKVTKETPEKAKEKKLDGEAIYKDFEDKIRGALGSKVSIQRKDKNKGKIVIEYFSGDEFERIYEMLTSGKSE